jgi:hypothetical protein
MKFYTNDKLACAHNDGSMTFWNVKDKILFQNSIKVYNEPVNSLTVSPNLIVSATSSNKIGIHSNLDNPNQVS